MSSEWRVTALGDCVTFLSGNTPSKSNPEFWGPGTSWISAKDMKSFWVEAAEDTLTSSGVAAASRLVEPGTTLLLTRGMTLHNDVPIVRTRFAAAFNQDVKAVVPRSGVLADYVPYLLLGNKPRLQGMVDSAGHGTGRLNSDSLKALEVLIPPVEEQRDLAAFFSALDDRIALLRETNATLEAIAQALFKSWFVDFDPVHARARGEQPEGLPEPLAALFPDSFEESPLGLVPRGWRVMPFLEACDLQGGAQPPASTFIDHEADGYVRLLQIRDFSTDAHKTYIPDTAKLKKAAEDDVLIGRYGSASGDKAKDSLGRVCRGLSGAYNVALMKLCPVEVGREFAHQMVCDPRFYGYLQGVSSKAVQSGFSKGELGQYRVVVPPRQLADHFEEIGLDIWRRFKANNQQAQTLATLRDTLLPRLISGQLRLPEAKEQMQEVGL